MGWVDSVLYYYMCCCQDHLDYEVSGLIHWYLGMPAVDWPCLVVE